MWTFARVTRAPSNTCPAIRFGNLHYSKFGTSFKKFLNSRRLIIKLCTQRELVQEDRNCSSSFTSWGERLFLSSAAKAHWHRGYSWWCSWWWSWRGSWRVGWWWSWWRCESWWWSWWSSWWACAATATISWWPCWWPCWWLSWWCWWWSWWCSWWWSWWCSWWGRWWRCTIMSKAATFYILHVMVDRPVVQHLSRSEVVLNSIAIHIDIPSKRMKLEYSKHYQPVCTCSHKINSQVHWHEVVCPGWSTVRFGHKQAL